MMNISPEPNVNGRDKLIRHICEACGAEELLTSEQGYDEGWDYPPKMAAFKVIQHSCLEKSPYEHQQYMHL